MMFNAEQLINSSNYLTTSYTEFCSFLALVFIFTNSQYYLTYIWYVTHNEDSQILEKTADKRL